MMQLARVFKALKLGLTELEEYYKNLHPFSQTSMSTRSSFDPLCYPYCNSFSISTQKFHFIYTGKVNNGNGRVFEGKVSNIENNVEVRQNENESEHKFNSPPSLGKEIIIKFVRQYGIEGHLLLSSHDPPLAPLLYSVVSIGAGWLMVVMEKISNPQPFPQPSTKLMAKGLRKSIGLLHSKNLVHGDLRSNNMLVSSDEKKLYLIDFDWCGKEDEKVYPYFMNGVDIQWPAGASDGKMMKKKHDEEMMGRLVPKEEKLG